MAERVAIITGAGRGIGRATAEELATRGYRVALLARTERELHEVNKHLGGSALVTACDVTDHAAVECAVQKTIEKFGRVDAVVNNAGTAPVLSVEQTTPEEWNRILDTNLSSAFYFTRASWPSMKRNKSGVIVNVSSYSARDPFPGFAAYGAAKAGLNLLGMALAREGEPFGIRVHTVAPAAVETEMFRKIMSHEQYSPEKTLDPADVARVIAQCVTGEMRHTSGEVIYLHRSP